MDGGGAESGWIVVCSGHPVAWGDRCRGIEPCSLTRLCSECSSLEACALRRKKVAHVFLPFIPLFISFTCRTLLESSLFYSKSHIKPNSSFETVNIEINVVRHHHVFFLF